MLLSKVGFQLKELEGTRKKEEKNAGTNTLEKLSTQD